VACQKGLPDVQEKDMPAKQGENEVRLRVIGYQSEPTGLGWGSLVEHLLSICKRALYSSKENRPLKSHNQ
jgi:hypothetical protein